MLDAEFQGSYPCCSLDLYESWPYADATPPTQQPHDDETLKDARDDSLETLLRRVLPMQIQQMIPCAHQCARYDAGDTTPTTPATPRQTLTDLIKEIKRRCDTHFPWPGDLAKVLQRDAGLETKKSNERKISRSKYEVFLGGSCNPTTWRQELAIPTLKKHGITFYNPQVSHWAPELLEEEHRAKETASVLFFVIDRQTRSVASIIEAAYLAASHGKLILVIVPLEGPGQLVSGDPISQQEYEDLSAGQQVLRDLVERVNIPVYSSVPQALERTAEVCTASRILKDRDIPEDALSSIARFYNERSPTNSVGESPMSPSSEQSPSESLVDRGTAALLWSFLLSLPHLPARSLSPYPLSPSSCDSFSPDLLMAEAKDVYLGGSCGSSTWRERIAIPVLKKYGLSYFNPKVSSWDQRLLPAEAAALQTSRVLLFVITSETRSLSAMALAAHYVGLGFSAVLCVQQLLDNCEILGEKLTRTAIKDYNRGRSYLVDIAKREGVPVFDDIGEAVNCAVQRSKQQC